MVVPFFWKWPFFQDFWKSFMYLIKVYLINEMGFYLENCYVRCDNKRDVLQNGTPNFSVQYIPMGLKIPWFWFSSSNVQIYLDTSEMIHTQGCQEFFKIGKSVRTLSTIHPKLSWIKWTSKYLYHTVHLLQWRSWLDGAKGDFADPLWRQKTGHFTT